MTAPTVASPSEASALTVAVRRPSVTVTNPAPSYLIDAPVGRPTSASLVRTSCPLGAKVTTSLADGAFPRPLASAAFDPSSFMAGDSSRTRAVSYHGAGIIASDYACVFISRSVPNRGSMAATAIDFVVTGDPVAVRATIEEALTSRGFSMMWQDGSTGIAVRGSRVANVLIGALAQYFRVGVRIVAGRPGEALVRIEPLSSGWSGGVVGVARYSQEYRIARRGVGGHIPPSPWVARGR